MGPLDRAHTFTGLVSSTEYELYVRAQNTGGASAWASVVVTTLPTAAVVMTVTPSVVSCEIGGAGQSVSWAVTGGVEPYTVRLGSESGPILNSGGQTSDTYEISCPTTAGTSSVTFTVTDADPTTAAQSVTIQLTASLARPTGLEAAVTSEKATLSWEEVSGATGYQVKHGAGGEIVPKLSTERSHEFDDLRSDFWFTLYVRARQGESVSAWAPLTDKTFAHEAPRGLLAAQVGDDVLFKWDSVAGVTRYEVRRREGGQLHTVQGTTYSFTGQLGDRTLSVRVEGSPANRERGGSAWASITPGAPAAAPLGLTVSPAERHCVVSQEDLSIGWEATGGEGRVTVTVDGEQPSGGLHLLDCPATVGKHTFEVVASDEATPPASVTETVLLVATQPLIVSAVAKEATCEQGQAAKIGWSVVGGAVPYVVTVDGEPRERTATEADTQDRSTNVVCGEPGTQEVVVAATDASLPDQLMHGSTVSLTVSESTTPTLRGRIRAQIDANGRAEFQFALDEGDPLRPDQRFMQLAGADAVEANRWYQSSELTVTIEGEQWTAGWISARLIDSVCPPYVEVSLLRPDGTRLTPNLSRFEHATVALERWRYTEWLTVRLSPFEEDDSTRSRSAGDWLSRGESTAAGLDGGAMAAAPGTRSAKASAECPSVPAIRGLVEVEGEQARLRWWASVGATGYQVRSDDMSSDGVDASDNLSHLFAGLAADQDHTLGVRAVNNVAASDWNEIELVRTPEELDLTASLSATSCATGGGVNLHWSVTGGKPPVTIMIDSQTVTASPVSVMCQDTAGTQTVTVVATDASTPADTDSVTLNLTVFEDLSLSASASSLTCEAGDMVDVTWSVTGGEPPVTITVDGQTVTASPVSVTCQDTAGTQTVTVVAADAGVPPRSESVTLSLTVIEAPTVRARIYARYLEDGRAEFKLDLEDVGEIVPDQRFLRLEGDEAITHGRWLQSELLTVTVNEVSRTVGKLSVRLVNTVCPPYVEMTLLGADGERVTPADNTFYFATVPYDSWRVTEWTDLTLGSTAAVSGVESLQVGAQLASGPSAGPGTFGGLMGAGGAGGAAKTVGRTASCPTTPTGLSVDQVGASSVRLNWDESDGARGYDVRLDADGTLVSWPSTPRNYVFAGLDPGTDYTLYVRATNNVAESGWSSTTVTTLPNEPEQPDGLSVSGVAANSATLHWSGVTGATSYEVRLGATGTVVTKLGTARSHFFSGLSSGTIYTLYVRAINAGGPSDWVSHSVTTVPSAPVVSVTQISATTVSLSWSTVGGAVAYQVAYCTDCALDIQTGTSYTFTGLTPATSYTFGVSAYNASGSSAFDWNTVTTTVGPPPPPSGLSVSGVTANSAALHWSGVTGATSYEVRLGATGTVVTKLGTARSHFFSGLSSGTIYTLYVRAINAGGPSDWVSHSVTTVPSAPVVSVTQISATTVSLSWSTVGGAVAYQVAYCTDCALDIQTGTSYTFTGLTPATSYTFGVSAYNASGSSAFDWNMVTTTVGPPPPPSGLSVSGVTANSATLHWSGVTGATSYEVRLGATGTVVTKLSTARSHFFSGLSSGTIYTLYVRAINAGGPSDWVSHSVTTVPSAPVVSVTQISATTVSLSWSTVGGAVAYQVAYCTDCALDIQTGTSYTFTGLTPATSYTFGVSAYNASGSSAFDWNMVTTTVGPPPPPSGLSVSGVTANSATLHWSGVTGATSYEVRLGATGTVVTKLSTARSHQFSGLEAATTYALYVRASGAGGDSDWVSHAATTDSAPVSVSGRVSARLLSNGKVELAYRLPSGVRIYPTLRFATPSSMTVGAWLHSSDVFGPAGSETNVKLGRISVRKLTTSTYSYIDICFTPDGADTPLCPSPNNFLYESATVNSWHTTGSFSFTLSGVASSASGAQGTRGALMDPPAPGWTDAAGVEGGLMSED